jgi:hypothetical protein
MKQELSHKQRKLAKKSFPKQARNEHLFTPQDYAALPVGEIQEAK